MFSNVGWGEILVLLIVGLLLIGPERLPGLIKEVRAVLLAARNAVTQAREQLDGELGEDFKEFSKPLRELNNVRQMGARGFITKTLLDGDDSFLTPFTETRDDLKATVDSVRRPQDALKARASSESKALPSSTDNAASAAGKASTAEGEGVEVAQQADMGESRIQDELPVETAAQELTEGGAAAQEPAKSASGNDSSPTMAQGLGQDLSEKKNQSGPTLSWDDVL
ncbi:Sec-independent protein translocase protein TatB [Corynebacterium falsenii]|uniref:Sec-independent protein translocase protein TatB n=1 Tax=Corynebacterium falsenii TaxID=108486 RepID=UPI003FD2DC1F